MFNLITSIEGNCKGILNEGLSAGLETTESYDLAKTSPEPTVLADGKAIRGQDCRRNGHPKMTGYKKPYQGMERAQAEEQK
ncbi:hypothetical protein ACLOJK_038662 [Asimina triloba]